MSVLGTLSTALFVLAGIIVSIPYILPPVLRALARKMVPIEPVPELVVKLLEIGEGWTGKSGWLDHPTGVLITYGKTKLYKLRLNGKDVEVNPASKHAIEKALSAYLAGKEAKEFNATVTAFAQKIAERYGEKSC